MPQGLQLASHFDAIGSARLPTIKDRPVMCGLNIWDEGRIVLTELTGHRGISAAKQALASLEQHGIAPLPKYYEVWLNYHAEIKPALRADMDKLLAQGRAIDEYVCTSLHATHIDTDSLDEKIRKAGDTITSEIAGVVQGLSAVKHHTTSFGKTLADAGRQLDGAASPQAVRSIVAGLSNATAQMSRQSMELEAKLNATAREVGLLKAQLEEAKAEAGTDALTGIANRKVFEEQLTVAMNNENFRAPPAILIIGDIDHFKQVNDTWGHQTGDQVIRFVASVLTRFAPEGSTVARIGGEEFALLMPAIALDRAKAVAQHIRAAVEGKKLVRRSSNEDLGRITISLGLAQAVRGEAGDSLVARADAALYASKRNGRNQVSIAEAQNARAA
jgi:diguanylate cyclase